MKSIAVFLLLISLAYSQTSLPNSYNMTSNYILSWGLSADGSSITVQLTLDGQAWVGICFHNSSDSGMTNGDFVVATFQDNGSLNSIDDRVSPGEQTPSLDTETTNCKDNLISASASQISTPNGIQTILTFQRLLNTGDACDCEIVNQTMNFAWAFGESNSFSYHGPSNRGSFQLNLFTGEVGKSSFQLDLQAIHGTMMVIAFGFLMSLGTFLPRYLKQFWWWFPLHIVMQVTAVVISLTAFGIAIYMSNGSQFSTVHSYFGIVTLLLAFISPFIGTASHFMWKPSRRIIPIFPDMVHWWVARIAILLSYCTIFLGFYTLGVPASVSVGFLFVIICYFLVYIFLDGIAIKELGFRQYFTRSVGFEHIDDYHTSQ